MRPVGALEDRMDLVLLTVASRRVVERIVLELEYLCVVLSSSPNYLLQAVAVELWEDRNKYRAGNG